jgi:hypothetical protein
MGTVDLGGNGNHHDDNCAEGARAFPPSRGTVIKAINDCINYLRLTFQKPGSDSWMGMDSDKMKAMVNRRALELCGMNLWEFKPRVEESELRQLWPQCRKHGYKMLRDARLIETDNRPLFDEEDRTGSVVYAYIGTTGTMRELPLVKIGTTAQPLGEYLSSKRLAHNPQLLASCPGDRVTEQEIHKRWARYLATGREWFYPDSSLLQWIRENFLYVDPAFDIRVADAQIKHSRKNW